MRFFVISLALTFGLLLVGSVYAMQESFATTEPIPSPRQQLTEGISPEDIQCRENRVLVIRDNGNPACVTEKTAEKRGWKIIQTEFKINSTNENTTLDDEDIVISDVDSETNEEIIIKTIPEESKPIESALSETSILNVNSLIDFVDDEDMEKEDQNVDLASYAEYKKMFSKDFRFFRDMGFVDMSGRVRGESMTLYYKESGGKTILDIDAMFDKKPVIFPENSLMYVQTDKTEYNYNETIHIKGQVADVVKHSFGDIIAVRVSNNNHPEFNKHAYPEINLDGSFETTLNISDSQWFYEGIYTIRVAHTGRDGHTNASTEIKLITGFNPPMQQFDLKEIVLDLSSPTEFVDDGREYPRAMGHRGSPQLVYDSIIEGYADVYVDESGVATFTSKPHEKYSVNEGVGFYVEDWIPTHIPDGQRLLYADTGYVDYSTKDHTPSTHKVHWVSYHFVPTTFELTPFTTNHNLHLAKGFTVGISYSTTPLDEIEDSIERMREFFTEREGGYGEIRDLTRDGKPVLAAAGGNGVNPYQAVVGFHPDEFTNVHVNSKYHTLDELILIFDSIMK